MRESMLTNGLTISNFSGGAPAEERDWDPISPQASKHSQALWILLWRDQVSRIECVRFLKIEMCIVHIKHVNISFSYSGSISFLSLLLAERCTSLCRSNPSKGKWSSSTTTMLHLKKSKPMLYSVECVLSWLLCYTSIMTSLASSTAPASPPSSSSSAHWGSTRPSQPPSGGQSHLKMEF